MRKKLIIYGFTSLFEEVIWGSKKAKQKTNLVRFIDNASKGFFTLLILISNILVKTSRAKRKTWELTAKYSSSFSWKIYIAPILITKRTGLGLRFIFCF